MIHYCIFYKAPTGNHTVLRLHAFSLPTATLISGMILPPAGQKDSVQLTGLLRLGVIFLLVNILQFIREGTEIHQSPYFIFNLPLTQDFHLNFL